MSGRAGPSEVKSWVNKKGGHVVRPLFFHSPALTPPPPPGNVTTNFGFENGTAGWSFFTNGAGPFSVTSSGDPHCDNYGRVSVTKTGNNIQLFQTGFRLEPDTRYTLRFAARSSGGQDVAVYVHRHTAPNTNYGVNGTRFDLTPQWQTFETECTTKGNTAATTDTRLRFWLAPYATAGAVFDFDEVVLMKK